MTQATLTITEPEYDPRPPSPLSRALALGSYLAWLDITTKRGVLRHSEDARPSRRPGVAPTSRECASLHLWAHPLAVRLGWVIERAEGCALTDTGRIALSDLGVDLGSYWCGFYQGRYDAMQGGGRGPDGDGDGSDIDGYRHGFTGLEA